MRKYLAPLVAVSMMGGIGLAQECASTQGPICNVPRCVPQCPQSAPTPQSAPEGAYVRGPESGEFQGGGTSFGVKGFGFKLPSLSFDGPEFRLPHLTRYRQNPVFHSESARAPFVRGPVAQFNQVQPEAAPQSAPDDKKPQAAPDLQPTPDNCVPPSPPCYNSASVESRLRNELARKDAQLRKMNEQLARLESTVNQLTESRQDLQPAARKTSLADKPQIVEASYSEEEDAVVEEPSPAVSRSTGNRLSSKVATAFKRTSSRMK